MGSLGRPKEMSSRATAGRAVRSGYITQTLTFLEMGKLAKAASFTRPVVTIGELLQRIR